MKGVGRETTRAGDGWYFSIHPRPCPLCPFAALTAHPNVARIGVSLRDARAALAAREEALSSGGSEVLQTAEDLAAYFG